MRLAGPPTPEQSADTLTIGADGDAPAVAATSNTTLCPWQTRRGVGFARTLGGLASALDIQAHRLTAQTRPTADFPPLLRDALGACD
ncbi:MAG: hypothetical protein JNK35_02150 [Phycisphaerae bacterium]|nr:hypothetical protein [Phycisphaerae bacterium]